MPRPAGPLLLLALAVGCDRATEPADTPTSSPAFASAAKIVDPSALTPDPAVTGAEAECQADGQWIICHTTLTIEMINRPLVDFPEVPCGTIYETSIDTRAGIRWYNAGDSVIVKRHVTQSLEGSWSLSPDGTGPTVTLKGSGNWYDADYADPNDIDSGTGASHGELTLRAPGYGTIAHIAGLDTPEGHRGLFRIPEDPAVAAELCAALTR
jgi:hypothetical protein